MTGWLVNVIGFPAMVSDPFELLVGHRVGLLPRAGIQCRRSLRTVPNCSVSQLKLIFRAKSNGGWLCTYHTW